MCFFAAAQNPEKFKFLILMAPEVDLKAKFERNPNINIAQWRTNGVIEYQNAAGGTDFRQYKLYEDAQRYNPWAVAKNIKCPTIIIHGDNDQTIPLAQSQRLQREISGATLVTLSDCGHTFYKSGKLDAALMVIDNWLDQR